MLLLQSAAPFGAAPGAVAPVAPTIYEWDFEGATNAIASGDMELGNGNDMIDGTNWVRDTVLFYSGAQSVKQTYAISGGNVGTLGMYTLASPVTGLYTRFAYHQTDPFNDDGGGDNNDIAKLIRYFRQNLTGPYGSLVIQSGSEYRISIDNLVPNSGGPSPGASFAPNVNLPAPTPNSRVGQWTVIQFYVSYAVEGAIAFKVWIGGTQYFDYTFNCSKQFGGSDILAGNVQFDGTINSMASVSQNNYDYLAFSTTFIDP